MQIVGQFVPPNARSVVLNVTATEPDLAGFLGVFMRVEELCRVSQTLALCKMAQVTGQRLTLAGRSADEA